MAVNNFVYTAHKNVCGLGARSARASVSDVQVAQGAIAPHKEPVATLALGLFGMFGRLGITCHQSQVTTGPGTMSETLGG